MASASSNSGQPDCCPKFEPCAVCDVLDIRYRLPFRPVIAAGDQRQVVPVEVTLHYRLSRCSGPLAIGDIAYSTTLLPGEKVRLFTSDRHSRFSFDSETKLAYRQETTSEESFFMAGMARSVSDLTVLQAQRTSLDSSSSSVSGGGGAGIDLGFFSIGGSVSAGSHDAHSTSDFASSLSSHASASSSHWETAVRAASSVSIGEVATRAHQEGESEDQYESASRVFANPNRCRALSFTFYRINKCQTLKFELVEIERRVDDPAAPTGAALNPAPVATGVSVIPSSVLATATARPDVAVRANQSVSLEQSPNRFGAETAFRASGFAAATLQFVAVQIPLALRQAALAQVDADLVSAGLLDKSGSVSEKARARLGWERQMSLPTAGVIVKGCLDDCDICEPELGEQIKLELERSRLENALLQKQIDLLEQSQEYRCCPQPPETEP